MASFLGATGRARSIGWAVSVWAATALFSPSLLASPDFPSEVMAAVPTPCKPQCTICHMTNEGKYGTLRENGFGYHLQRDYELYATHPETVAPAINAARPVLDGDGDGRLDVDELSRGEDPNSPDPEATICGGPQYGCGSGRIARGYTLDGLATLFASSALVLGAASLRRRLRR